MLVGKGGYAILDLKHVGNSGTISGVFFYAKKLCGTGKTVVILNPSTGKEGYPASTGTVSASTVIFYYFVGSTQKKVTIGSNDSVAITTVTPSGGASDISDLGDVEITSPSNGQVLKYNSTTEKWENSDESGGASDISDLGDVTITSPSNGQVLKYNSDTEKWENSDESGGAVATALLLTNALSFTWDSTSKSWSASLTDEQVAQIGGIDNIKLVTCQVPTDENSGKATLQLRMLNGMGDCVTNIRPFGAGYIAQGKYYMYGYISQVSQNTYSLVVEPYALTQPS